MCVLFFFFLCQLAVIVISFMQEFCKHCPKIH